MRIINSKINNNYNVYQNSHTPQFKAMKKTDFRGIDFAVVEKFKAPIEKFNVLSDFQRWAEGLVEKIKSTNFLGQEIDTIEQRKEMLDKWYHYVIEENGTYTKAIQLLILSAITKNLGKENDNLPPTLNKGILADCINDIDQELEKNKKTQFDFNKMYQNKLRAFYMDNTKTGESETKWIIIPSEKNDFENFEDNVEKLKILSHKSWCTKSYNAEPYLKEGDFHVYLENGEPKIGIRFIDDSIQEIQGENNDSSIPLKYFDIVKEHVNNKNYKLRPNAKDEIKKANSQQKKFEKIKNDLSEAIKTNDSYKIYKYLGIKVTKDKNEKLILSEYRQPNKDFSYLDLGIDEDKLFQNVIKIKGNAIFTDSKLTTLGNLNSIGGDAYFKRSKIVDLGNLTSIGGDADFINSKINSLGNLNSIGGDAYFDDSKISDLGELKIIGQSAFFDNSKITDLKNLYSIGGDAVFNNSNVKTLGNLHLIGGEADFTNSKIISLNNLQYIGGNALIKNSKLKQTDFQDVKIKGKICK